MLCRTFARHLGFIFQNFNLLQVLTAYENIEYPLRLGNMPTAQRRERVRALLDAVGLSDKAQNLPGQLSGGQRQRRDCPRAGTRPGAGAGRRAHSQPGQPYRCSHHRPDAPDAARAPCVFRLSSHDPQVQAAADDTVVIRDGRITAIERRTEVAEVSA